MKYPKEEVLKALVIIKETCLHGDCESCSLEGKYEECGLYDRRPDEWEIKEIDVWKAFR